MTALDVLCAPLTRDLFGIAKFLSIWRMELLHAALQCGTIMTLISPGDCTVQCDMWLWNHDSEFNVIRGSGMICHRICPVAAHRRSQRGGPCGQLFICHCMSVLLSGCIASVLPDCLTLQSAIFFYDGHTLMFHFLKSS